MCVAQFLGILLKMQCHPLSILVFRLDLEIPKVPLNPAFPMYSKLFLLFFRSSQVASLQLKIKNY
jgi:hypothetical protein